MEQKPIKLSFNREEFNVAVWDDTHGAYPTNTYTNFLKEAIRALERVAEKEYQTNKDIADACVLHELINMFEHTEFIIC